MYTGAKYMYIQCSPQLCVHRCEIYSSIHISGYYSIPNMYKTEARLHYVQ